MSKNDVTEFDPKTQATMKELKIMKDRLALVIDRMPGEKGEQMQKLLVPSQLEAVRNASDEDLLLVMELASCCFYQGLGDLVFSNR